VALTIKQRKFVAEYVKSGNATGSALTAGYSKRTARSIGQENLTKPDIRKAIEAALKKIEEHKIADATEALQFLTLVLRGKVEEEVVVSTKYDVDVVKKHPDIKSRMAAAKEIIKRHPDENSDPLLAAQARKAKAEAEIAEAKAKREMSEDTSNITINIKPIQQDGGDDSAD
jgi:phage terminase small subunit